MIKELHKYFMSTRGCGHTEKLIQFAKQNKDMIVVAATANHAAQICDRLGEPRSKRVVHLDQLENLQGLHLPVVLDHHSLGRVLVDHLEYEKKVKELAKQLSELGK